MATTSLVEEVGISGKTKKTTSVFWRNVPEEEQFRNLHMPGVILNRSKTASKNSETTKRVKVVQKSKSDSAISNTRSNEVFIANKQAIIHPKESNQTTNVTGIVIVLFL